MFLLGISILANYILLPNNHTEIDANCSAENLQIVIKKQSNSNFNLS